MTPVSTKFMEEFEMKPKKRGCFGFLRGRKVKVKKEEFTVIYSPLTRSKAMDDVRLNPYLNAEFSINEK